MSQKILLQWRIIRAFKPMFYAGIVLPVLVFPMFAIPILLVLMCFRVRIYDDGVRVPFRKLFPWSDIQSYQNKESLAQTSIEVVTTKHKLLIATPRSIVPDVLKILEQKIKK